MRKVILDFKLAQAEIMNESVLFKTPRGKPLLALDKEEMVELIKEFFPMEEPGKNPVQPKAKAEEPKDLKEEYKGKALDARKAVVTGEKVITPDGMTMTKPDKVTTPSEPIWVQA